MARLDPAGPFSLNFLFLVPWLDSIVHPTDLAKLQNLTKKS